MPGSQAQRLYGDRVQNGLLLTHVNGASTDDQTYDELLSFLRAAGRPLEMTFQVMRASTM